MASNRQRLQKIFGFYPKPFQLNAGPVTITPLPEFEQSIADTLASDHIEKDWIYAPPQQTREFGSGEVRDCPYSARVFGLSKTHLIEHTAATGEEHLDFHLWALSFFMGMRLTATEAGFLLDATPLKAGKLVDFVLQGSSLTLAVELADDFWRTPAEIDFVNKTTTTRAGRDSSWVQFTPFSLLRTRGACNSRRRYRRLLVALIGGNNCSYVRSPVNTRQRHHIDLGRTPHVRERP